MKIFPVTQKAASRLGQVADVSAGLGLAAAPSFALMAWISAIGSPGLTVCSGASGFVPINDMALMYVLMSFFHLPAWLRLFSAGPHAPTPPSGK
ncbi:hypothetical protein [Mesorhizobium sp. RMAD-H1]|uniref:hypothetical protein n=1 Tax=Mesorhizobium sp. RMAD-H1 TaxID=2587065 RepID=UPI0018065BE1|nr:hypothetical protein [Mesorhizobium sp. RMAD-H1]MBB2974238.1 hypothetical protein [Mesorhizobium sp. RMAD-H1]